MAQGQPSLLLGSLARSEDPSVVDRILGKPVRLADFLTALREVTAPAVPLSA